MNIFDLYMVLKRIEFLETKRDRKDLTEEEQIEISRELSRLYSMNTMDEVDDDE